MERWTRTSSPTALPIPMAEAFGQGSHEEEGLGCRVCCCMVVVETCLSVRGRYSRDEGTGDLI